MNTDSLHLVSLGEILIDFTPYGNGFDSETGNPCYVQNPGGAPANVLACFAKLGGQASFIGAVGKDSFGSFLREALVKASVNADNLVSKDYADTTLAFVTLSPSGDRSFSFYRRPGADTCIAPEDVPSPVVENCSVFHFGSLSMTCDPSRSATFSAIRRASASGALISFDPNWRPSLWKSNGAAVEAMRAGLLYTDLLKVSEEEAFLITGEKDREAAGASLLEKVPLVVMTLGAEGCIFFHKSGKALVPAFDVKVVDTTGAGDAFWGAFLFFLLEGKFKGVSPVKGETRKKVFRGIIENLSFDELSEICRYANASGSLCASGKGAIPALPSRNEIEKLIQTHV